MNFGPLCHYCYEQADRTARHVRANGFLRRLLRLPERRYLVEVCCLHFANPAAYNHPAPRAARARLDRWIREDSYPKGLLDLEVLAERIKREAGFEI
ncbi:hypothetical protein ACFY36_01225 [Actinoplanes sp. NPDC000266]